MNETEEKEEIIVQIGCWYARLTHNSLSMSATILILFARSFSVSARCAQ